MLTVNEAIQRFQEELVNRAKDCQHRECLFVMLLNAKQEIIRVDMASSGTIAYHQPIIRECLRLAIKEDATGIILAHNHPSGDPAPSMGDITFTQALKEAAAVLDVNLQDHLILGDPGVYSMARDGGLFVDLNQLRYLK